MNKILPNNILKCIPKGERVKMGKAGRTSEEAIAKHEYGQERKLHQQICQLLDIRGMVYVHSRTDKRSTTAKGVPDFIIFTQGFPLLVEVKVADGKLSDFQIKWADKFRAATGGIVFTVRSLEQFKKVLQ